MSFVPDVNVIRVRKFSTLAARRFEREVRYLLDVGQPVIPVVVESFGGEAHSLLHMLDVVEDAKARGAAVTTVVMGKAMSCGALLAASGSKGARFVSPRATIMVHDISGGAAGKVHDVAAYQKQSERLNNEYWSLLDKYAGKRAGYFSKLADKEKRADLYFTAEEAVKHGLAEHVHVPIFKAHVTVGIE